MNTTPSSSERPDDETHNELEILFEEIDEIEKMLEPLNNAESDSLRSQTEDQRKKLDSLDEGGLSPFRLSAPRREISRLKARAESMANNSLVVTTSYLRNQIEEIEKVLEPLKDADADALRSEKEETKKKLESVVKTDLPSLQEAIRNLKERTELLATRSFLLGEIGVIEKMLVSIRVNPSKRTQLKSLEAEKEDKKRNLQSADDYELAALRKEINKIKERVESLATRESWLVRLGKVSVLVWLAIIPLLIAIYTGYIAILQRNSQTEIRDYAITQTAVAATQTEMASATETATPTLAPIP